MPLRTMLACNEETRSAELARLIASDSALILVETISLDKAMHRIKQHSPQLLWIDLQAAPAAGLSLLGTCKRTYPALAVLVSHGVTDPELVRTTYRLHGSDYLDDASWNTDLHPAIERIERRMKRPKPAKKRVENNENFISRWLFGDSMEKNTVATLLISDAKESKQSDIQALIKSQRRLKLVGTCSLDTAHQMLRKSFAKLVWVHIDPHAQRALDVVASISDQFPLLTIFASCDTSAEMDGAVIRQFFRAGVSDFFDPDHWRRDLATSLS